MCGSFLFWVTLSALKWRDVAEVHRVFEWFIRLVARLTFAVGHAPKIDRVLERTHLHILRHRSRRVVQNRMTDVAVVANHLAGITNMLAIVTT